jgi:ribosomal 30S subunit maturation factor RimM
MYLGKDATTEDKTELGKVSDVAVSSQGEVYYLVEKGKVPTTRYYFTQEDVLTSNERVVTRSVREFTDDIAKRSHFLCALYGVEVRDTTNHSFGVIDNFAASPEGALVVIEDAEGNTLLGRYRDLDLTRLSKFAILKQLPAQDSFDKHLKNINRDELLTKGISCDLSGVAADEGLLSRIRKKLAQSEEDRIITDQALVD